MDEPSNGVSFQAGIAKKGKNAWEHETSQVTDRKEHVISAVASLCVMQNIKHMHSLGY